MHPSHAAGNYAFRCKDYAKAIEYYTKALEDDIGLTDTTTRSIINSNKAAAWLKLGNFNAALDDAQRATQLDPSNGKAWYRQACALAALDHTKEAHTAALHAAQHVPQPHADVDRLLHALTISDGKSATGGGKNETAVPASAQACVSSPNSNPKNTSNTDNTINSGATTTTITTPNPHLLQSLLPPLFQDSIFIPTPHGHQYNLMILLHGLGDTQQPFADLARSMMLPDTASLACGGPCVVPETGGRSWFAVEWVDEEEGDGCSVELVEDAVQRRTSVTNTIQQLTALIDVVYEAGWPYHRIHMFGYGQGGTAALHAAHALATRGHPIGSCVAVCAAMLPEYATPSNAQVPQPTTQVLLMHGVHDDTVTPRHVQQSVERLTGAGMRVHTPVALQRGAGMLSGRAEMRVVMEFWGGVLMAAPPEGAQELVR